MKAFLLDIDGTLAPQGGLFRETVVHTLKELHEKGNKIIFTTGKPFDHVYGMCRAMGFFPSLINAENGGVTSWLENNSWQTRIEANEEELGELALFIQEINFNHIKGTIEVNGQTFNFRPELKRSCFTVFPPTDDLSYTEKPKEIFDTIIKERSYDIKCLRHPDGAIDVFPQSVSKIKALLALKNDFPEIEDKNIIVAVDSSNDIELAESAPGPIICPADSKDQIKEIIKEKGGFVSADNDGQGFLDGLKHYEII